MKLFTAVYHEPGIFDYPLGRKLKKDFPDRRDDPKAQQRFSKNETFSDYRHKKDSPIYRKP